MDEENTNKPKRRGLRTIIILLILLCLLVVASVAGYLFWQQKAVSSVEEEIQQPIKKIEPVYVPLNTFTVSLKPTDGESDRVLYIGITVSFTDADSTAILAKFMPEYRSRLFILFTQQTYEALSTDEGKNQLITSIKHELSQPLAHQQAITPAEVLINEFILR